MAVTARNFMNGIRVEKNWVFEEKRDLFFAEAVHQEEKEKKKKPLGGRNIRISLNRIKSSEKKQNGEDRRSGTLYR